MKPRKSHTLEVWGEFACFTSPMKVERWSYPFITPSAARGIFDAIFVNRHEFRWQIDKIELLSEPQYIELMRNEVKEKGPSAAEVENRWMADVTHIRPILADADEFTSGSDQRGRTQRQTVALRNVRYRLTAHVRMLRLAQKHPQAYDDQFQRRVDRGQQFSQPCMGCHEFPAFWAPANCDMQPVPIELDAGWMLYDVFDLSLDREGTPHDNAHISVFHASVMQGILMVPPYESELVKKGVSL
jgi:CRISPR-associated protein Cas5d